MKTPAVTRQSFAACLACALLFGGQSATAQEREEIVLGSAILLTGKYATNGIHAKNGYEYAIKKISDTCVVGTGVV